LSAAHVDAAGAAFDRLGMTGWSRRLDRAVSGR
jgi:hypothetical protein